LSTNKFNRNAKIAGLSTELHFSADGNDYAWLLTMFYVGYIIFEWLALMWKVVPAHIWAAAMVLGWGLVATLQSFTTSWSGMMALRFLLGSFEAGFGPGVPYYLSFFYLRHEIGLRIGLFLSAGPLGTCFAGALAYGITSGHVSIANWRLLFLVEGLPTILMAVVAWFYLPDSAEKAKFLNEDDQIAVRARAVRQLGSAQASSQERMGSVVWSDIGAALLDPKVSTSNSFLPVMHYQTLDLTLKTRITSLQ
jgi:MFS family permease